MRRGIVVFTALLTCACGFFGSNPKKSVSKFLGALADGEYIGAYEYVSAKDKAFKDLQTFVSEPASKWLPEGVAIDSDYEISSVDIEGSRAEVHVAFESSGSADGAPVTRAYEVIKEGKTWGVFLNWEAEALMAEASQLREQGKLKKAMELYKRILAADPDHLEALDASSEVERLIALLEITNQYRLNHMEILNFRVRPDDRRTGPGTSVSGRILNNGHRTLRLVEVTIYFTSSDGKIVADKMFQPIPSTEITYRGETGHLRRGAVREFGYILDERLPPTWSGRAQALITKIEFEEST